MRIKYKRSIFPSNAVIIQECARVGDRLYQVYFDISCHQHNPDTALYLIIRLLCNERPVSICPEDDMPDILAFFEE